MSFLDLLFPKRCLGCKKLGQFLCSSCQRDLKIQGTLVCPVCEGLSVGGRSHSRCLGKLNLDGLVCLWQYQGLTKALVKALKYQLIRELVEQTVDMALKQLWQNRKEKYLEFWQFLGKEPIILPIALHPLRWRWRGFNQAEIIGQKFAAFWQLPFSTKILERIKVTQPQVELRGKQRQQNIKGAFGLASQLNKRKNILGERQFLLIDDVWTTGATLREAGKVLKQAGAAEVWGLTLAR